MPAIRSSKGNTPNGNDKGKGKAPNPVSPTTQRKNNKGGVDPCEICGFVVSRKGDVARHAKTHAVGDTEKIPCRWEGCEFSTLQKSNLETHYRRSHTGEKHLHCKDDPQCVYRSYDPALLLRHRKQKHGYIPRSGRRRSASVASQFPNFPSAEGSTSGPSSSQPQFNYAEASSSSAPFYPLEYTTPSAPFSFSSWSSSSAFPSASELVPHQPPLSTSPSAFLATPTAYHDMTTYGPSPNVMSFNTYSVQEDSFPQAFALPVNDDIHFDPSCLFSSEILDGWWMDPSYGSEMLQGQGQNSLDVVHDVRSEGGEVLFPPFSEMGELEWLRSNGLPLNEQQQPSWSSSTETSQVGQYSIDPVYHNLQIERFHDNVYDHNGDWI